MKKLIIAAALLVASGAANAVVLDAVLGADGYLVGRADNPASPLILDSIPACTYDTDSGRLACSGELAAGVKIGGVTPLFTDFVTDLSIQDAVADASGYECVNGLFATIVATQVCGNYGFGDNVTDDSVFSYDVAGLTFTRMIMPDDVDGEGGESGVRTIADYNLPVASFGGGSLVLQSDDWFNIDDGDCDNTMACDSAGTQITFSVVPVPAAVWLFGSALGMLGWIRRRASA